ncbi:hypothetical protein [Aeribacillus pallidus]|uniref:hypothetical protein n=1 Tax=Aeribacillus pallidus TaxID=33936 RepID=UPI003D2287AB
MIWLVEWEIWGFLGGMLFERDIGNGEQVFVFKFSKHCICLSVDWSLIVVYLADQLVLEHVFLTYYIIRKNVVFVYIFWSN